MLDRREMQISSERVSHTRQQQQQQWEKKKKNNVERVGVEVSRVSRVSSSLLPLHEDRCRYVFFSRRYTRPQKRLSLSFELSLSSFSPSSPVDFRCSTWSKRTRACPRFYEVGNFQFLFTLVFCFCAAFALSFISISVNFLFHLRFCHVESFGREFELVSRRPLCVIGARWALMDDSRWCKKVYLEFDEVKWILDLGKKWLSWSSSLCNLVATSSRGLQLSVGQRGDISKSLIIRIYPAWIVQMTLVFVSSS